MSHVFNMPSGVPFLHSLAHGLTEEFGDDLQKGLILLPTRRAARALADAFVAQAAERGVQAALLPRLRPLADVNPDEPPFEPGELAGRVAPGIDPVQRRFEIAKLVAEYHRRASDLPLDPAAALHMADPLIAIMDDAALEEASLTDQDEWQRVCSEAAIHFQHAATLYRIIETHWPERLRELKMMDPSTRRVALLDALAEIWSETPPDYPVIIAGSTGTLKATARLMRVVANMPKGRVVLPGLQEELPDRVWNTIDARHPQNSLKGALKIMGVSRDAVPIWPWVVGDEDRTIAKKRRRILAEALVPVDATGDWLGRIETLKSSAGPDVFKTALQGLSLIEARTDTEEALAIALILRETLETEGRTAALVTPDQLLAQRVQARLARWDVTVDMSQGVPVEQTPIGVFLTALLELTQDASGPVELNLVLTHALTGLGDTVGNVKTEWEALERKHFRGLRPGSEKLAEMTLVQRLYAAMAPLLEIDGKASPDVWAEALIAAAEAIVCTDDTIGARRLWSGNAGHQASAVLDNIAIHGFALPDTDADGFARLLRTMLQGAVVRPNRGAHPRLSILGPLEARLLEAEVIILGGLNEGTWPSSVNAGPFLSRGMREAMKLSLPERRYGLAAHDFAELAANGTVYLTRSQKDDSGPTVASRWVWRLKTLLRGAMSADAVATLLGSGQTYLDWSRQLDRVETAQPVARPNPKPPVDKRWERQGRRISITAVSTWIRDPYSLFARDVLRLKPLDPLDAPMGAREYGTAIHAGVERYINQVEAVSDPQNKSVLISLLADALRDRNIADAEIAKETARLDAMAQELIDWFAGVEAKGFDVTGTEVKADKRIDDLNFLLTGSVDMVARAPQGYGLYDFKTGGHAAPGEIAAGFDLQLPLSAWLAANDGLTGQPSADAIDIAYIKLKGYGDGVARGSALLTRGDNKKSLPELTEQSIDILRKLIKDFDKPETGYPSQPRAKWVNAYGDYDDLARRSEWSATSSDGGES